LAGNPIVISGLPLPSDSPFFLSVLAIHVPAGLLCVIAGMVAMLSRKQRGPIRWAGTIYYWGLAVVSVTMAALAISQWSADWDLFVLGVLSFLAATIGRMARRRQWPRWARLHVTGMAASYILMLTAFYVDNGPNLPLLRQLPVIAFWISPAAIGTPILLNALLRHPLGRRVKKAD
jgi:hypothetical protein